MDNDLDTVSMDHMASSTSGQPSLHPDVSSGDFGKVVKLKAQRELSNDHATAMMDQSCFLKL